ncbi:hypothetical protein GX51_07633 [Blastomyces parvus]|uniref:Telomere repeat-binding factor dimerisation domain-containing protein n=1 Tax=Blastomyces parvus TaxID=2060905 RepID=A0A2B7WBG4_9EURO|nr:hypothetical protein GX51_07633 [Blastomyces parvus]
MPATARATSLRAQQKSASNKQPSNLRRSTRQTRNRSKELGGIDNAPASPSKPVAASANSDDSEAGLSHTPVYIDRYRKYWSKDSKNISFNRPDYTGPFYPMGTLIPDLTRQKSRRSERSVPGSPVDHFNITGTTLLATDSEHESRELDPSIMIEALPDLDNSAKNVLRILVPQNFSLTTILENLKNATFRARVKRVREMFEAQKKYFGGRHFIAVEATVNMIPSLKHIPWYPHEFIQKTNLAQFALDLIPLDGNMSPSSEYTLSYLDESFPALFISSLLSPEEDRITTPGQSALLDETFQLGLELRTQRAIAELRSGEQQVDVEFAPDSILEIVFTAFANSDDESERLLGWKINGLRDENGGIPERFREEVLERRESIRNFFEVDESSTLVRFDELESMFPWSEFVDQACKWIRMRANEIDEQLGKQASLNEAVEILQIEVDRRSSLDQQGIASIPESTTSAPSVTDTVGVEQAGVLKPQMTESATTGQSKFSIKGFFKSKAFVSRLVNLQAGVGSASGDVAADQPSGSPQPEAVAPARDSTPHINDGERTRQLPLGGSPGRPSPSEIVKIAERQRLATSSQRQRPTFKTPPAAFIDRQADARRLSPIGSSQLSSSRNRLIDRSKKRQASEIEQNEDHAEGSTEQSEEEGFEADTRTPQVEKNRASIARLQGRKRRRVGTEAPGTPSRPSATPSRQSQYLESRQSGRGESASVEFTNDVANIPPASTAPEINRRVRKPGGGRIPWSVDECNQLKNLIVRYGPKWAKIKQFDDSLEHPKLSIRDQVNLKDKARQMAVDYYKTGQPLPENFEKVALKTDDKRKLREMGVAIFEDMPERD